MIILYNGKEHFMGLQNQRFRLKRVIFVQTSKIREKGLFFKLGYEHGIRFGREGGGGWWRGTSSGAVMRNPDPAIEGLNLPMTSTSRRQWRGALMFSLICAWVNNREASDLGRHRAPYDVIEMLLKMWISVWPCAHLVSQSSSVMMFEFCADSSSELDGRIEPKFITVTS